MKISRFFLVFLLGFVALPICDGIFVMPDLVGGRALATGFLFILALAVGVLLLLLRRPLGRLLPAPARIGDALPLTLGLALALVPQVAPFLPGKVLGGRLSFNPVWAPLSTVVGLAIVIPLLGRLLARVRLPARGMPLLALGAWLAVAGGFALRDAQRREAVLAGRVQPIGMARSPQRPDVTLIVLDTLRAEGISGTWQGQTLMPFLSQRLSEARVYTNCYAGANSTPPGHATLFTGIYPAESGTLSKGNTQLPPGCFTVAEYLREFGYRTAGLTSNQRLDGKLGFAQGFEAWDDSLVVDPTNRYNAMRRASVCSLARALGGKPLTARLKAIADRNTSINQLKVTAFETARQAGQVLDGLARADDEPLFFFVNFIDPHLPYATQADLAEAFLPNIVDERMEAARHHMPTMIDLIQELARQINAGVTPANLDEFTRRFTWIQEAYWEQCRQLDEGVRALFAQLEQHGLLDPEDLVVITSDHGEQMGEHAEFLHGHCLYEGSVRVPFAVFGPGFTPGTDATLVSGADFFPTVLFAMGIEPSAWPDALAGLPLQAPVIAEERFVLFESGAWRGFRYGTWKMLAIDHGDRLEWTHAFDLAADPLENVNLIGPAAPAWVQDFISRPPISPTRDATVIRGGQSDIDLAALGYVNEVAPQ